jgi:NADH-quinone oxidoreductase subunit C
MAEETPKEGAGPKEEAPKPAVPVEKNPIEERLTAAFGDIIQTRYNIQGELEVRTPASKLTDVCRALLHDKETPYDYLRDVTAVDWKDRIEMVYHVCATSVMRTVVVKCDLDRAAAFVDTLTDLWPAANWQEREVYDLMGVSFTRHPDMRRILLPEEWSGNPLRKDYVMPED